MNFRLIMTFAVALLVAGSTFAADKEKDKDKDKDHGKKEVIAVIKGKVVDDNGKPADAEIHVRALDRKAADTIVLTDSRGHYIVTGLDPGRYSVTAYDDVGYARSRAIIHIPHKGWANVNFDLGLDKDFGNDASRIGGHEHFTQPNSHGGIISATQ